jgi:hypothetical protein
LCTYYHVQTTFMYVNISAMLRRICTSLQLCTILFGPFQVFHSQFILGFYLLFQVYKVRWELRQVHLFLRNPNLKRFPNSVL